MFTFLRCCQTVFHVAAPFFSLLVRYKSRSLVTSVLTHCPFLCSLFIYLFFKFCSNVHEISLYVVLICILIMTRDSKYLFLASRAFIFSFWRDIHSHFILAFELDCLAFWVRKDLHVVWILILYPHMQGTYFPILQTDSFLCLDNVLRCTGIANFDNVQLIAFSFVATFWVKIRNYW